MPKVNPAILTWARETAGLSLDQAAAMLGWRHSARLGALEHGEQEPTRRQLVLMSEKYRRPLLAFYLAKPPRPSDKGKDFRTLPEGQAPGTQALLDALLRDVLARQGLVQSALDEAEEDEPLGFVGSARLEDGVGPLVASLRKVLRVSLDEFRRQKTSTDAFKVLRTGAEKAKAELRHQVGSAGLGQRLANSWRDIHYDNRGIDAASLVYTKAPQIIRAFDEGALIRSRRGRFLAIPTENAPRKGTDGKRIRPSTFPEHRFGPLRFVPRRNGPSLLVVGGLRASFSRRTGELRGFRPATERARQSGQGLSTVVMFLLVPQVKLRKRLDVARAAEHWTGQLPALIEQQLRSE